MTSQIVIKDIDIIDYQLVDILYLYNHSINIFKNLNELNYNKIYNKFNNIVNNNIIFNLESKPLIDNITNGYLHTKLLTPIINDNKYLYGNSIIEKNNKYTIVNWGVNKISDNLNLEYDNDNNIYYDKKNKIKFYDFIHQLNTNTLTDYNLYTLTNNSNFNICLNDKVNIIRNCNNNCYEIIGSTYYKNKNIIDENAYSKINYEERVLLQNEYYNITGYKINKDFDIPNLVYIKSKKLHGFILDNNYLESSFDSSLIDESNNEPNINKSINNKLNNNIKLQQNKNYNIYILSNNENISIPGKDLELIISNNTYYINNKLSNEDILNMIIPPLEYILYSIKYNSNITQIQDIYDYIEKYNYNPYDLNICNINIINSILYDNIENYKTTIINSDIINSYNININYYINLYKNTTPLSLILFYFKHIKNIIQNINFNIYILL